MGGTTLRPILSARDIAASASPSFAAGTARCRSAALQSASGGEGLDPGVCGAARRLERISMTIFIGGSRRPGAVSAIAVQRFKSRRRSKIPGFAPCAGQCRP